MPILDDARRAMVRAIFERAGFMTELGVVLEDLEYGKCTSSLKVTKRHLQQDGFIHAGVQAAIADHTSGGAAGTVVNDGETILSLEFKVNLLRPAIGDRLVCRATVLKPGRTIIVSESEVYAVSNGDERMTSKATVTLAVIPVESLTGRS